MAQHDHMTGCSCGLYRECEEGCEYYENPLLKRLGLGKEKLSKAARRKALLGDSERMLAPIGKTGWTRQQIIDLTKTHGYFKIYSSLSKKSIRKVLRELCDLRILYCTKATAGSSIYVLEKRSLGPSDGANVT